MFEKLLEKICGKLNKLKISYMIIGGQAVLLYGEPRATKDIDITLGIDIDQVDRIKSIASKLHLKYLVDNVDEFVLKTMVLPLIDSKSGIRIDFIFSNSAYERGAINRTRGVKIGKSIIRYASIEDTIIHKIIAGRPRDIEDVRSIILKKSRINRKYIEGWLRKFEISLGQSFLKRFRAVLIDISK